MSYRKAVDAFPLARTLATYRLQWLRSDATAGLSIAAVALPSAIAYPAIAGLPPETGLYASLLPLIGYALFGPSRTLIVGPDAATMTALAAALAAIMAVTPGDRVMAASALAAGVAVCCFAASILRLGVIASFLSRPILIGFMGGISLSIMVGQINRLTGVKIDSDGLVPPLLELLRKADMIHWPSLVLGVAMFVLLQGARAWRLPVPGPVVVVVVSVVLSAIFNLAGMGIRMVGEIPPGLPPFSVPAITALPPREFVLGAMAVWLVSFGAGIVTARSFAALTRTEVDANKELVGFGAANLAAGLFGGFPVSASDSRTAVNLSAGGKTQVAGLVAAAALAVILLFLNEALRFLPTPALGAILVSAALGLIDIASLRELWRISRMEFAFALIGMWGAISLGALSGVALAVGATLLYVLLKDMRPRDALLGRIPGRDGFHKLHRSPQARPVPGLAVCLIQGSLLFFNVDYVKSRLEAIVAGLPAGTQWFILDASAITQVDSTAASMLEALRKTWSERGLQLGIAELHSEPAAIFRRAGVLDAIGGAMVFADLGEVMPAYEKWRAQR